MALGLALREVTGACAEVDWATTDGDGRAWLAMRDGSGQAMSSTRPLDLLPQMDGFCLSEEAYGALGQGESHIPPRSGLAPVGSDGKPLVESQQDSRDWWLAGRPPPCDAGRATECPLPLVVLDPSLQLPWIRLPPIRFSTDEKTKPQGDRDAVQDATRESLPRDVRLPWGDHTMRYSGAFPLLRLLWQRRRDGRWLRRRRWHTHPDGRRRGEAFIRAA